MQVLKKHTLNPEITILYQFHDKKNLFKVPKIGNINFWIENDPPPPLALFRKSIRFGSAALPLGRGKNKVAKNKSNLSASAKSKLSPQVAVPLLVVACQQVLLQLLLLPGSGSPSHEPAPRTCSSSLPLAPSASTCHPWSDGCAAFLWCVDTHTHFNTHTQTHASTHTYKHTHNTQLRLTRKHRCT